MTASNEMDAGTRAAGASLNRFAGTASGVGHQLGGPTSANVNKLGHAFQALIPEITGVSPHIVRLTSVLSHLAVGGGIVTGVVIGVAAIGFAYKKLTEDARAAREENDKLIGSLVKAAGAQVEKNLPVMRDRLENLQGQLDEAIRKRDKAIILKEPHQDERQKLVQDLTTAVNQQQRAINEAQDAFDKMVRSSQQLEGITVNIPKLKITEPDTSVIDAINAAWLNLARDVTAATATYLIFGDAQGWLQNRLSSAQGALQSLLRLGVDPATVSMQRLITEVRILGIALTELPERFPTLPHLSVRAPELPGFQPRVQPPSLGDRVMSGAGDLFKGIGTQLKGFGGAILGVMGALMPWQILLDAVKEAFGELLQNVAPIITILATALMPVFKAMFPLIKMVAIGFTYVGQVFLTVAGAIQFAVGNLIKGLGKFLDALPLIGDFGLIKAGQTLIDMGQASFESAHAMVEARRQIEALEWTDALDPLKDAASETAAALRNVPEGFKVALERFNATIAEPRGRPGDVVTGGAASDAALHLSGPITVVTPNPDEFIRQLRQKARRGGAVALRPAF